MTDLVQTMAQGVAGQQGGDTIEALLGRQQAGFARVLPSSVSPERFARLVLTECRKNRQLLRCSPISLLGAAMTAAQLGLEPGPLQHCYLVPRKGEVQFQLGYRGMIELALRGGGMLSIDAHVVGEHDEFEYAYGTDSYLYHVPQLDDPGAPRCVYAVARLREGGTPFVVLSLAEVERRRRRSSAPDSPAWKNDLAAMMRKTAIRALEPYLPKSAEFALALKMDEQVRTDWSAPLDEADTGESEDESVPTVVAPALGSAAEDTPTGDAAPGVAAEAGEGSDVSAGDQAPAASEPPAVPLHERPLTDWPVAALQNELRTRGLKVAGNRGDLIARLEDAEGDPAWVSGE